MPQAPAPGRIRGVAQSGTVGEGRELPPPRVTQPSPFWAPLGPAIVGRTGRAQNGLMRVVATRIEQDGTMQRRMVDTARCSDGPRWEELACRALAAPPPYRPVAGSPIYHISLDDDRQVLVAEQDLAGALLDLVTAVLAMGEQVEHASPSAPGFAGRRAVTGPSGPPGWRELELGAPPIARLGMTRLSCPRVALLGTLRRDASPRISPVEPTVAEGQLLIGAMAWSGKAADLRRDPRYVLHSAVIDPDSGEGELKLSGAAIETSHDHRRVAEAWWSASPPDKAVVFCLGIEQAVFVEWDTGHALMTVHRWSPRGGYTHSRRHYP